jgi:outer membrane biosynthesis protein TonB
MTGELWVKYYLKVGGFNWPWENRPEVIAYYDAKKPDKKPSAENKPKIVPDTTVIPNPAKIEIPGTRKGKSAQPKENQETETPEIAEEKSKGPNCDSLRLANEALRSKLAQMDEAQSTLGNLANQKGLKVSELERQLQEKDQKLADLVVSKGFSASASSFAFIASASF